MSSFTSPLVGTFNDAMTKFTLTEEFSFYTDKGESIVVPKWFVTDFASIPLYLRWLVSPIGRYGKAAVLHDYMYSALYYRKYADDTFLEAMKVLKVNKIKAYAMYYTVRVFGCKYYKGVKC